MLDIYRSPQASSQVLSVLLTYSQNEVLLCPKVIEFG